MAATISFENVTKTYAQVVAVGALSLEVERGEAVALLGPNGAGKSTTLYMAAGLVRPSKGRVQVLGAAPADQWPRVGHRVGVLLERPALYEHLTARQNLLAQARLAGREVNADRSLDFVGLLRERDRIVRGFSQGMRQRLALASTMLLEPELLLLDEPTTGLDRDATANIVGLLRHLVEQAKVTLLLCSHQLYEVEQLCDRIAVLDRGRLVHTDSSDALLYYDQRHVEVVLDGCEGAARRLSEQPWVADVAVRGGKLYVELVEPNANQLAAYLVTSGYKLAGVSPTRRSLDAYLEAAKNS